MQKVVLIGGGHAHIHLVSCADEFNRSNIELELIDPGKLWYSGMATGMLAERYSPEEDSIDLSALCKKHGVAFHQARATGLNTGHKLIELSSGQTLTYDILSINLGSTSNTQVINDPEHLAWTVKPIPQLLKLQASILACNSKPTKVAVIGGGPTGCEVAANIVQLCEGRDHECEVTLFHRGERLISEHPSGASKALKKHLEKRGISVMLKTNISSILKHEGTYKKLFSNAKDLGAFDQVIVSTGLIPSESVRELGLGEIGLEVETTLASTEFDSVFGAGDCIEFLQCKLPKLGVFGVRQAPILKDNLIAAAKGRTLKEYRPQKKYLTILNLGKGDGLAVRGQLYWLGKSSFLIKHFIDTRFMRKYKA